MFRLRKGHTYRIYDWNKWTIAFDHESRGGMYSPRVSIIYRQTVDGGPVIRYRRLNIPMPVIGFARAYQWRKFGMLRLYSVEQRMIYRLFAIRD